MTPTYAFKQIYFSVGKEICPLGVFMIEINGAFGEGGGQIVRSALALSIVAGKPFRITNIRAGRKKPGLGRQHLTAVNAAAEISRADVRGNEVGSQKLSFAPGPVEPGSYQFRIGTAGSTGLVLQTVLPGLLTTGAASTITLDGGTHNPFAPPYTFMEKTFVPILQQMGAKVEIKMIRPGFFPKGGGRIEVVVEPVQALKPIFLEERGVLRSLKILAVISRLPNSIGEREVATARKILADYPADVLSVEELYSPGPGNAVFIIVQCAKITEVFTGFGERGIPAEQVAEKAAQKALDYLKSGVVVGSYLADQLLLPMAIAGGGAFLTRCPSLHTITNKEVIETFLDVQIEQQEKQGNWRLAVVSKTEKKNEISELAQLGIPLVQ